MTVIRNENADAYVKSPRPEIQLYLVHGIDQGLVHERAATLIRVLLGREADSFRLTRIDGESIVREPGRLADEAHAIPMLGGHRVVWVDARSRDLGRYIEPLIAHPPKDCRLIVEAGNLKRGAVLRRAFEGAANAISIECYPDERRAMRALIDAEAREAGVEVTGEARDALLSLLGQDRLTTRGEIAKLMLYAAGSRRIEITDVEAIVTDAAASVVNELVDQSLLGRTTEVERAAARFFGAGGDPAQLILRLVSQLTVLQNFQAEAETGVSPELNPFMRLPTGGSSSLARQAERWTLSAMEKKLPTVQKTSARVRRGGKLGVSVAMRALLAFAASSRTDAE